MSVGDFCNREVVIVGRGDSIETAIQLMRQYHTGSVVVVDETSGQPVPVGILTDRDIVIEILARHVDLQSVSVGDAMSYQLVTARESDEVMDVLQRMRTHGVRRVPVVSEAGALVGILAADDVIELLSEQLHDVTNLFKSEVRHEKEERS